MIKFFIKAFGAAYDGVPASETTASLVSVTPVLTVMKDNQFKLKNHRRHPA